MASLTPKKSTTQDDEPQFEEDNSPPRIQARHYVAAFTNKQAPPYGGATFADHTSYNSCTKDATTADQSSNWNPILLALKRPLDDRNFRNHQTYSNALKRGQAPCRSRNHWKTRSNRRTQTIAH